MNDHESFQGVSFLAVRAAITPRACTPHSSPRPHHLYTVPCHHLYQTLADCSTQVRRFSVLERIIDFSQLAATCLLAYGLRPFARFRAPWTSFVFRSYLSSGAYFLRPFARFRAPWTSLVALLTTSKPRSSVTLKPPLSVPPRLLHAGSTFFSA